MLFLVLVTSTKHYWVVSAERRRAGVLRLVRLDLLTRWRYLSRGRLSLSRPAFLTHYIELIARQPTDQFDLRGRLCSEFISERSQLRVARKIHPREGLIGRD